jgi:hypothetical protein
LLGDRRIEMRDTTVAILIFLVMGIVFVIFGILFYLSKAPIHGILCIILAIGSWIACKGFSKRKGIPMRISGLAVFAFGILGFFVVPFAL